MSGYVQNVSCDDAYYSCFAPVSILRRTLRSNAVRNKAALTQGLKGNYIKKAIATETIERKNITTENQYATKGEAKG